MATKKKTGITVRQMRSVDLSMEDLRDYLREEQLRDIVTDEQVIEYILKEGLAEEMFWEFVRDSDSPIEVV